MKKIILTKSLATRGFVYRAYFEGKEVYKSSVTHREYVAILFDEKFNPMYRYGRVDLIGKGDSRLHIINHSYPHLAVLDSIKDLPVIPPIQQVSTFVFEVKPGYTLFSSGTSEADARESLKRNKRKTYGVSLSQIIRARVTETKEWGRKN